MLSDKIEAARRWWLGKMVRRQFAETKYAKCTDVEVFGPPSGWTAVFVLVLDDPDFKVGNRETIGTVRRSTITTRWKYAVEVEGQKPSTKIRR